MNTRENILNILQDILYDKGYIANKVRYLSTVKLVDCIVQNVMCQIEFYTIENDNIVIYLYIFSKDLKNIVYIPIKYNDKNDVFTNYNNVVDILTNLINIYYYSNKDKVSICNYLYSFSKNGYWVSPLLYDMFKELFDNIISSNVTILNRDIFKQDYILENKIDNTFYNIDEINSNNEKDILLKQYEDDISNIKKENEHLLNSNNEKDILLNQYKDEISRINEENEHLLNSNNEKDILLKQYKDEISNIKKENERLLNIIIEESNIQQF